MTKIIAIMIGLVAIAGCATTVSYKDSECEVRFKTRSDGGTAALIASIDPDALAEACNR